MAGNITIGEAELEVMKVLWRSGEAVSAAEIGREVEEHGWKRTTIATFLARLVQKGAVSVEKRGKAMYYTPILTAKEYKKSQLKSMIANLFDGSAQALVASLFEERALSEKDIEELKEIYSGSEE